MLLKVNKCDAYDSNHSVKALMSNSIPNSLEPTELITLALSFQNLSLMPLNITDINILSTGISMYFGAPEAAYKWKGIQVKCIIYLIPQNFSA